MTTEQLTVSLHRVKKQRKGFDKINKTEITKELVSLGSVKEIANKTTEQLVSLGSVKEQTR